jgi:MoaA/NifB/PqqE/SkfB family radical SAM enzyme
MNHFYPERLSEPELSTFYDVISKFVELGINKATISGGDPLTIKGIVPFLKEIRERGINDIKLDTVGIGLLASSPEIKVDEFKITELLNLIDIIGIPLDGWSNHSVNSFRKGNSNLFDKTCFLLDATDRLTNKQNVVINTVVNSQNVGSLTLIYKEISKHKSIKVWNLFQYTPTDQVTEHVNDFYSVSNSDFHKIKGIFSDFPNLACKVHFHSIEDRLGHYLLINSDGAAWLPDKYGKTIYLGKVHGREKEVLTCWRLIIEKMIPEKSSSESSSLTYEHK